jgi:hypothetical protein
LIGEYISSNNTYYTGMRLSGNSPSNVAIFAGASVSSGIDAPFRVTNNGTLMASGATIIGKITATSGSIGGFNVGEMKFIGSSSLVPVL